MSTTTATITTNAAVAKRAGRAPGVCKPTKHDNVLAASAPPPESTCPTRQGQRFAGDKAYLATRDYIAAKVVSKPDHFSSLQRKKTHEQIPDTHVYADPMNPKIVAGAPSGHVPRGRRTFVPESHDVLPSNRSITSGPPPTEVPHFGKKITTAKNSETGTADLPPRGAAPVHRAKKSESKGISAILGKVVDDGQSSSNQHSHPSNTPLGDRRVRRPPTGVDTGAAGRPSAESGSEVKIGGGKSVSSKIAMERQHGTFSQERARGGGGEAAVSGVPFASSDVAGIASTAAASSCNRPHKRPVEIKGNKAAELQKKSATSSLNGILREEEGRFKKRDYTYAPPWGTVGTTSSAAPTKTAGPTDSRPSWQRTPRGPKVSSGSERKHIQVSSVSQAVRAPWATD